MADFARTIADFVADTKAAIEQVCLGAVLEVGDRLVMRSPTGSGHFRANWRFSMDAPDLTVVAGGGRPARPSFSGSVVGRSAFWCNSVSYGPALEEGSRGRRPGGFVRLTAQEFRAIVAAEAARSGGPG